MPGIHITDIEAAINFWRTQKPSPDGICLSAEVRDLADVYALMIFHRANLVSDLPEAAQAAWNAWYATTPDSPCIAICSTSQGDEVCKGCGRTFDEVKQWTALGAMDKRAVWRRISAAGTAWRFNRYADRAQLR